MNRGGGKGGIMGYAQLRDGRDEKQTYGGGERNMVMGGVGDGWRNMCVLQVGEQ